MDEARSAALARYNEHVRAGREVDALLALCDALECARCRLADSSQLADSADVSAALSAAELSLALRRPDDAHAFAEEAEVLVERLRPAERGLWRLTAIAHRMRTAIEAGDPDEADRAISQAPPDLVGAAATDDAAVTEWLKRHLYPNAPTKSDRRHAEKVAALLLYSVGLLLAARGFFGRALAAMRQSRHHASASEADYALRLLGLRLNLAEGLVLVQMGRASEAASAMSPVAADETRIPTGLEIRRRVVLARAHMVRGELRLVQEQVYELLDLLSKGGSVRATAACCLQAARLFVFINRNQLAEHVLARLERANIEASVPGITAEISQLRHFVSLRTRKIASGSSPLTTIYEGNQRKNQHPDEEESVSVKAYRPSGPAHDLEIALTGSLIHIRSLLDVGNLPEARRWLDDCRERFRSVDSPLFQVRLSVGVALVLLHEGAVTEALQHCIHAVALADKLGAKIDHWQALRVASTIAETAGHNAHGLELRNTAEAVLRSIISELEPDTAAFFLLDKSNAAEKALQDELGSIAMAASTGRSNRLRRWLGIEDAPSRSVRRCYLSLRRFRVEEVDTRRLTSLWIRNFSTQMSFRRDRAAIAFVILRWITLIVVRVAGHVRWQIVPVDAADLVEATRAWHRASRWAKELGDMPQTADAAQQGVERNAAREALRRASDAVTKLLEFDRTLELLPPTVRQLALELDAPLFGFPFAALEVDGRFLVERYAISYRTLTMGSTRARLRGTSCVVAVKSALAYRPPESEARLFFPPLGGIDLEIGNVIASYSKRSRSPMILDDRASSARPTRKNVLTCLSKASRAYLACHGFINTSSPKSSGLVVPGEHENADVVSIQDIEGLGSVPGYVALSACYSADCLAVPSHPPISLPHTFLRAGTKFVLAALWPVADVVAPKFMSRYLSHVSGNEHAHALSEAQRAILRGEVRDDRYDLTLPFYWAGYAMLERSTAELW